MSTEDLEKLTRLPRNDGSAGQNCGPTCPPNCPPCMPDYECMPDHGCAPEHDPPCSPNSCRPSFNHEEFEEPALPARRP